jgi:hypothetical protein
MVGDSDPKVDRCREFTHGLGKLIERFGGTRDAAAEARCVAQIVEALSETAQDGQGETRLGCGESLSPLDVVRIRAGKFAATRLPPALYRDPSALTALRGEIHRLARAFVGEAGSQGSRFG